MENLIYDRTQADVDAGLDKARAGADFLNRIENWSAYLAEQLREYGYAVTLEEREPEKVELKNLIVNPSFERDSDWSAITYDTEKAKYGTRSSKFPAGTSTITQCLAPRPTIGHTYYGRREMVTAGNNTPGDCRFEWFAGDGVGRNWVFAWNRGDYPQWKADSAIYTIDQVNTESGFAIRNFSVNTTADTWTDGLLLIDLTEAFGSGNEPDKEWCDANIPFFEDTYFMSTGVRWKMEDIPYRSEIDRIRRNVDALQQGFYSLPDWREIVYNNTVDFNQANALEWDLQTLDIWMQRMIAAFFYCGELYSGEV